MSLTKRGWVYFDFKDGKDRHETILNEIAEMRREMRRVEAVLGMIEAQVRGKAPMEAMKPNMSNLFWWFLSVTESFFTLTYLAYGKDKLLEVARDFMQRLALVKLAP